MLIYTHTSAKLSISKDIADRFNLRSRQEVYVELVIHLLDATA